LALVVLSLVATPLAAVLASVLAGVSWIFVLSTLQVSAQTALPNWVRARGLALFLTLFFGSMALGSAIWGKVASELGIGAALLLAASGVVLAIPLTWRARLGQGDALDLAPSLHWPEPLVLVSAPEERGPAMTMIEYRIHPSDVPAFLDLMSHQASARRRSGALQWWILEDAGVPGLYMECFVEGSWLAHLRHHERVSGADRLIQDRIRALHRGAGPPAVRHLLAPPAADPSHRGGAETLQKTAPGSDLSP
jgi:hypothetical protein